ncbi:hypothetical protein IAQ67_16355 [Paenibacillus peoriae]|uniref:Uncharacterized protein n=1 Tax=Paenibacillus peoriae TaxID=59893 RepID=A0A7H0Y303_9BACL|nr:hypothetical protein [Paenibacillus peoriae]QNR65461.1 hypothetical protein IAQ67_16355 [Paenibacillus peoriae]
MQYHELIMQLEIPSTAEIIVEGVEFLLHTDKDREDMFLECLDNPGSEIEYLRKRRKYCIDTFGYKNKEEFVYDYEVNCDKALERLFQEKIIDFKMKKLKTNDPIEIYNTYVEQGKYCTFLEVAYLA